MSQNLTGNRSAKEIVIKPIGSSDARDFVKRHHYSGKVVNNSKLHFGVFWDGSCEGVLQFGPPMRKDKMLDLVKGTGWSEMIELNRMAFSDVLPKNSESRAISICMKIIKKNYPHIKWVLSFSDGTQCGDGTIYRASGFVLTQIKKNTGIIRLPNGEITALMTVGKGKHALRNNGKASAPKGSTPLSGYQFRYLYFLHHDEIKNINCEILPFSKINEMGAGMYKGEKKAHVKIRCKQD